MEFKGTNRKIKVANTPDKLTSGSTEGLFELYTSPFGREIVGYAKKKEDGMLFSKAPEMLEMLKKIQSETDPHGNSKRWNEIQQLIKEATEL
jgi:hypothetical protein